jgi:hypothetical protein
MSLFLSARKSNQKELVAARFSFKGCGRAGAMLSENQEATIVRIFKVVGTVILILYIFLSF